MMQWLAGLAVGAAIWTLIEYVMHRFVFHQRMLGRLIAREHIRHHSKVDYFVRWTMKVAFALPLLLTIMTISSLIVGVRLGTSVPIGVLVGYGYYEALHRLIHVREPWGAYGRWARRHHLLHHFGRSDMNHGVTSPLWDIVFGTHAERQVVRIPKQHVRKFPWLIEGDRATVAIATTFSDDYRIA